MRRLAVLWVLGVALLGTLLGRLFGRRRGLAAFHESYGPERLLPVTPAERAALTTFSGCIACGLCDRGEGERRAASAGAYPGLMTLVLASSRGLSDLPAAAAGFAHVPEPVLAAKEAICPTRVPLRRLAAFVREAAGQGQSGSSTIHAEPAPED